ncbi:MAG: hypothetical protein DMG81_05745 [Acidobacteria bacterium]|nr:MAG: hypothetical protein DMG81_05745 [Acidobacteriota bacterium]
MRRKFHIAMLVVSIFCASTAFAAPKPHVIAFGKWTAVKWYAGPEKPLDVRIRPLFVDTRLKEYTTGAPHEITDRLFVVRRMFRLNDALPAEATAQPRWVWERGGWLLVDRLTGRITQINLPEFDPFYSTASWYRDYVAYWVAQLGRRKPILKKPIGEPFAEDSPDSECPAPTWERQPTRVTFVPEQNEKITYAVHGHAVDVVSDVDDEEESGGQ